MSKINKVKIPGDFETQEEKVEYLVTRIEKVFSELNGIEKRGAECAIRLGSLFLKLKKVAKKKKWKKFVEKNFPDMSIRTAQRYMRLARKVDLDKHPTLALLGQTRLYELAGLAGKLSVSDFLDDAEIDLDVDLEEEDSINSFKGNVDEFIHRQKKEKRQTAKEDDSDQQYDGDDENDESLHEADDDADDDSSDVEKKPKSPSKKAYYGFDQSAATFIKSIDLVMNYEKAVKKKRVAINKTIKKVKQKLKDLKKYQKSLADT